MDVSGSKPMNEQNTALKKSNLRLALALAAVAAVLAMWPLYILRQGLGG